MRAEKLAQIGELWQFKAQASVGGKMVAEGQLVLNLTLAKLFHRVGIAPACRPLISLRDYRTVCALPEFAIIIPACDEAACIGAVLDEFLGAVDPEKFVIAVGVNGSSDATARNRAATSRARRGNREQRGYGHGCQAAIDLTKNLFPCDSCLHFLRGRRRDRSARSAPAHSGV